MDKQVVITRESVELSNFGTRVYVTGPHFGDGHGEGHEGAVFSSTTNPAKSSKYSEEKAHAIMRVHGSWLAPRIGDAVALRT
jgi:hypothetical protein